MHESNTHNRVLLVEDDERLGELTSDFLRENHYNVTWVKTGEEALTAVAETTYDVVVLDVMLPGIDGLAVCRRIRPSYQGAVLMLTARGDEVDEIVGLEVGADDYLGKPVRPRLLLARLTALLRRRRAPLERDKPSRLAFVEGLQIDLNKREVRLHDKLCTLTTAEFDLLALLAENVGQPVDRDTLYLQLRGIEYDGLDRTVDIRVSKLRKKLGEPSDQPLLVKGVRGVGYMLAATPAEQTA